MNTSIVVHVPAAPPPTLAGADLDCVHEPLVARSLAPPVSRKPAGVEVAGAVAGIALEDGGIALALDPCDDLAPHWLAWMQWIDACQRAQPRGSHLTARP
jgi:hypothetical protein